MLRFLIKPSGFAPETPAAPSPHWVDELMERFDAGNAGAAANVHAVIDAGLATTGLSAAEASRQATGGGSLIKNIRNGSSPTLRSLNALGRVLRFELVLRPAADPTGPARPTSTPRKEPSR